MATINGTAGNDVITGTADNDTIYGGDGADRINGGAGNDVVYGGAGNDTLTGDAGNDTLYGGDGNDGFFGGGSDDTLYGENGDDVMNGDAGNDTIYGGNGNDTLNGGAGDDVLYGGSGVDILSGGAGNDTAVLELSSATLTSAMRSELSILKGWMADQLASAGSQAALAAQTSGSSLKLPNLGITLNTIEQVKVYVDGHLTAIDDVINQAPTANATASVTTAEDTPVGGHVVATDPEGDALAFTVAMGPAHGVLALDPTTGAYTYTPGANYNGSDSFEVKIADTSDAYTTQTVTVGVTPVNDAPVTAPSTAIATSEDTPVTGKVVASDVDGDSLTWSLAQGPAAGALTLDGATGQYTYTPAANFFGTDSFKVTVTDPAGATSTQDVSVAVSPVNDAPVAAPFASIATNEDTPVSGQVVASDADGDGPTWSLAEGPAHGAVTLDATNGQYVYTATANYSGADTFTVKVADAYGAFTTQKIDVAIGAVADAPLLSVSDTHLPSGVALTGSDGNDVLTGTAGDDTISGGDGNDTIYGDGPMPPATAHLAIDASLVDLDGSESLSILISGVPAGALLSAGIKNDDGSWSLTKDQLAGLSVTSPDVSDFTLNVSATSKETTGQTATTAATVHITLDHGTNSDSLDGGAGNDKIYGGTGNNILIDGSGDDLVYGNAGDDTFIAGPGNDTYDGGAGFDTVDMSAATVGVTANLSLKTATGLGIDKLVSIEGVIGSAHDDILTGSSADNKIAGGAGDDIIYGGAGNDVLYGGDGNDAIDGGSGNDVIYDGAGDDVVTAGDGDDYIYAGSGLDKYVGGSGFDTVDYSNATGPINVDASKKIITGFTSDTIDGIEKIVGTSFDDYFKGSKSANFFDGGAGNDTFRGMGGADTYTGGSGDDTYVWYVKDVTQDGTYLGADTITDFSGSDKLNLHEFVKAFPGAALDSVVKLTDGVQGTMVSVKVGTGFLDLVMLQGVHETSASNMLAHGQILT